MKSVFTVFSIMTLIFSLNSMQAQTCLSQAGSLNSTSNSMFDEGIGGTMSVEITYSTPPVASDSYFMMIVNDASGLIETFAGIGGGSSSSGTVTIPSSLPIGNYSIYGTNIDTTDDELGDLYPGGPSAVLGSLFSDWIFNIENLGGMPEGNGTICGDVTTSFVAFTINGVLPVELIYLTGENKNKFNVLNWQTASELNNEKFEIEESQDGGIFQKIGEVKGKRTTLEQQEYSFRVKNPRNGLSYYRLKQIDFDGQFEYSKVISINFKGENRDVGEFYPNPSRLGMVYLDYTSQNDEEIVVSVFDVTGKLVVNHIQQISNGDNNLSFDFSELNTGIYIVKIGDERNPTHRKLIIEK